MPVIPVDGAEEFANLPVSAEQTRRIAGASVRLHDVSPQLVDGIDPLTYEVIRHRLTSITEEMGEALKRMSGSVVVTDCNDFDAAIMDEVGDVVQVGLYNTELAASLAATTSAPPTGTGAATGSRSAFKTPGGGRPWTWPAAGPWGGAPPAPA